MNVLNKKKNKPVQVSPSPVDRDIGRQIAHYRRHYRISLEELAARIGVSVEQLQKYEAGYDCVTCSQLWLISCFLRVPIIHFFKYTGSKYNQLNNQLVGSGSSFIDEEEENCAFFLR